MDLLKETNGKHWGCCDSKRGMKRYVAKYHQITWEQKHDKKGKTRTNIVISKILNLNN